jgi:hypothetical protein
MTSLCSYDRLRTSGLVRPTRERRLTYLWFASPRPASLESKHERASNVQSGLALFAIICPISSSIRFTIRPWPVEMGESGAHEPFSLALTGLQPPLQMSLK